jgi:hypothetical protein
MQAGCKSSLDLQPSHIAVFTEPQIATPVYLFVKLIFGIEVELVMPGNESGSTAG